MRPHGRRGEAGGQRGWRGKTARMGRQSSPLITSLARSWQLLLIASLPGSALRIWAVLNRAQLDALARAPSLHEPSMLVALGQWSGDHPFLTLLMFPLLAIAGSLLYDRYGEHLPTGGGLVPRAGESTTSGALLTIDRLSAAARELLCAAAFGGAVRLERRRTGPAVVVSGRNGRDDVVSEFHNDADPAVAQRYRTALPELEQSGFLARCEDGYRPTTIGFTAGKFLHRRELDRIAARARHLDDSELALLRIIAECQHRYNAHKVALHRDGTRVCAIFGNGETVVVPGLTLLAAPSANGGSDAAAKPRTFEQLVQGIPSCYLAPQPGQLPRNPLLVRVTDTGLRYLRHTDVIYRDRAAA
jgi:hypothetical protein